MPQESGERIAKSRRREERLRSASALFLCVSPKGAQEYRPLVSEDGIQARPSHPHAYDEIVDRHAVVAFRPEQPGRLFQRIRLVEATGSSTGLIVILKHLVRNSLTVTTAFNI